MTEALIAAALIGLLGSGHCIGMCGGLIGAFSSQSRTPLFVPCYNIGRITTYITLGLLATLLTAWEPSELLGIGKPLRFISGVLLILTGLYIGNWSSLIQSIEKVGKPVWTRVSPLGKTFIPTDTPFKAILLGMIWGLIPCGLVYSTLAWSLAHYEHAPPILLMAAFGVGTLPSMLLTGLAGLKFKHVVQHAFTKKAGAVVLILMGVWTIPGPHQMWVMSALNIEASEDSEASSGSSDMMHHHHH